MGFHKRGEGGNIFKVTCGKFVGKIDGEEREEQAYTGRLVNIFRFEDDYEGTKTNKIEVVFQDGEEKIRFQFTEEAWYAVGFFQRIGKADLRAPITIGVMPSEQNDKMSFCWMKQGKDKITKDEAFPTPVKRKIGSKVVDDYTGVTAAITEILAKMQDTLAAIGTATGTEETTAGAVKTGLNADADLPF